MLAKITRSNQITIPKEILLKARLSTESDYVDVQYSHGVITIKPVDVEERVSPEQYDRFAAWALQKDSGDSPSEPFKAMAKRLQNRQKKR